MILKSPYVLELAAVNNGTINGRHLRYRDNSHPDGHTGLGYLFTGWNGDVSGNDNPLEVVMDANRNIGATFTKDTRDNDGDGLINHDELVLHDTDPNDADSDNDMQRPH